MKDEYLQIRDGEYFQFCQEEIPFVVPVVDVVSAHRKPLSWFFRPGFDRSHCIGLPFLGNSKLVKAFENWQSKVFVNLFIWFKASIRQKLPLTTILPDKKKICDINEFETL